MDKKYKPNKQCYLRTAKLMGDLARYYPDPLIYFRKDPAVGKVIKILDQHNVNN